MTSKTDILIVGAGPAGLATALEANRLGLGVRIIDKSSEPTRESRAVVINPRTLELLDLCGAGERLIRDGTKIKGTRIVARGRVHATLDASRLSHRYNFMVSLPQSETERALAATLAAHGVKVERGIEIIDVTDGSDGAIARARTPAGETTIAASWIVGADGFHSTVRRSLELDFSAASGEHPWSLIDIDLAGDAEPDHAEIRLDRNGPIMVRVPLISSRHRVISSGFNVLDRLPADWKPGQVHWQSDFSVSHRLVERRGKGHVWLIGDAAHVHSPASGRGMNLGIEDGVTFVRCIKTHSSIEGWAKKRQQRAQWVVRESNAMQQLANAQGFMGRHVAPAVIRSLLKVRPLHDIFVKHIGGLT